MSGLKAQFLLQQNEMNRMNREWEEKKEKEKNEMEAVGALREEMKRMQEEAVDAGKVKVDLARMQDNNKFQKSIIETFLDQKKRIDSLENKLNAT